MKKLLKYILSFGLSVFLTYGLHAQGIEQKFGAYALTMDSLYTHVGLQGQYVIVYGEHYVNDGFGAIFMADSTSPLAEVPRKVIKVTGTTNKKWIAVQLSASSGDTGVFNNPDYAVINILTVPPGSPADQDKYLSGQFQGSGAAGAWIGEDTYIQTWDAGTSQWIPTAPTQGQLLINGSTDDVLLFDGTNWNIITSTFVFHNGGDNYGAINQSIGNKRNKRFDFRTNNIIRGGFAAAGWFSLYYLRNGSTSDSVIVIENGEIRKVSRADYLSGIGGSGTVTSFSAGTLSPLFTTSVATATTTPALTFAQSNTTQFTVLGRKASGSGAYSFLTADSSLIPDLHSEAYYNTKYGTGGGTVTSVGLTSTDLTISGSPVTTSGSITANIATNAVTNAKMRQSAGLSVIGNSTNATANVADITGADHQLLRVSGTTLGFGTVDSSYVTGLHTESYYNTKYGSHTYIAGTSPITVTPNVDTLNIGIQQANSVQDGYLSSTDWNTFNNKQNSGSGSLSGGSAQRVAIWNSATSLTYAGKYYDTAKNWEGNNTTSPAGVLDIFPATFPGTISVTNGSATFTGTNTRFLSNFKPGDSIFVNATTYAIVLSVASNTSLTLTANYSGTTNASSTYTNPATARGVLRLEENGKWVQYGVNFIFSSPFRQNLGIGRNVFGAVTSASGATAFGDKALQALVNGTQNAAFGTGALQANTSGGSNTAVGYTALTNNNASDNTGIGNGALLTNTSGANNTAVGSVAMLSNNGGGSNTAVGASALQSNSSGNFNTAVGQGSMTTSGTGNRNVAMGNATLQNNASANDNIGIGYNTLNLGRADSNTVIGSNAARQTTLSTANVGVGYKALDSAGTGVSSVTITTPGSGYLTVPTVTFGNPTSGTDVATGTVVLSSQTVASITITHAGSGYTTAPSVTFSGGGGGSGAAGTAVITTGIDNTAIGSNSGKFGYGSRNIAIGYNVKGVANVSDKLYIDNADNGTSSAIYGDLTAGAKVITINGALTLAQSNAKITLPSTITAGGTTGDQTINKASGTVNFAAAATSLTVTNSLVTTSSIVYAIVRTNDATAIVKNVVPSNGSFVINLNAAATAETSVGFMVIN